MKRKELWLTDDAYVLKYFKSGASVRSATHKHSDVREHFQRKYPGITKVCDYYRMKAEMVELKVYRPDF